LIITAKDEGVKNLFDMIASLRDTCPPTKRIWSKTGSVEVGRDQLEDKDGPLVDADSSEKTDSCDTEKRKSALKKVSPKSTESTSKIVTPEKKTSKKSPTSKTKSCNRSVKQKHRFKRLKRALTFSRSRSKLSIDEEVPQEPHSENPTAASSGRSKERRQLDLLDVQIKELEEKIQKPGPHGAIGAGVHSCLVY